MRRAPSNIIRMPGVVPPEQMPGPRAPLVNPVTNESPARVAETTAMVLAWLARLDRWEPPLADYFIRKVAEYAASRHAGGEEGSPAM